MAQPSAYQRVGSQYDVTEAGVPSCSSLFFDGGSDSMATGSIDFTATDKMTVFAGLRKNSDVASIVFETSANQALNDGSVVFVSGATTGPNGTQNGYIYRSRGTALSDSGQAGQASIFAAPETAIISGLSDISGDTSQIRRNGIVGTTGTADQGTGNYGNYPLYIGARAGTSFFFNGNLFGLVVRGAASTTAQITATEAWLAPKTGVTL